MCLFVWEKWIIYWRGAQPNQNLSICLHLCVSNFFFFFVLSTSFFFALKRYSNCPSIFPSVSAGSHQSSFPRLTVLWFIAKSLELCMFQSSFGFFSFVSLCPHCPSYFCSFWLFITKSKAFTHSWPSLSTVPFPLGPSLPPSSDIWILHPASFSYSFQLLFCSLLKGQRRKRGKVKQVPGTSPIYPSSILYPLPKWSRQEETGAER